MLTYDNALLIAYEFVRKVRSNVDSANFTIVENQTREEPFGWVFQWNDKRYIETGNDIYALSGNQPIVVLREGGRVRYLPALPSNKDLDSRIREFAATLGSVRRAALPEGRPCRRRLGEERDGN